MKKKKVTQRNPVARNLREFNKATVEIDKKKRDKTGYKKHKEDYNA